MLCGVSVRVWWCVVCGKAGKSRAGERRGEGKKEAKHMKTGQQWMNSLAKKWTNTKKHTKHLENMSKQRLLSWHDTVHHGPQKKSKNSHVSQRIVFTCSLEFTAFSAEGPIPNAQMCVF